jgi:hypothetical protein
MARTRFLYLLLSVVVVGVVASDIRPAFSQSLDPQSLIGEWNGKWSNVGRGEARDFSGYYSLTIERVEGNQVYGSGEYASKSVQSFKFKGVLDGNHLRFGKNVVTDLEIMNDKMEGSATNGAKLSLTKKK